MSSAINPMPHMNARGANDVSGRQLPVTPTEFPTHLPVIFTLGERGEGDQAFIVSGESALKKFGRNTFDKNGPYATHATELFHRVNGNANAMIIQRIITTGAETATLRWSLDVLQDDIPTYERNADGTHRLDVNGDKVPTGATVPGHRLKWVVDMVPAGTFGTGATSDGTMTDSAGDPSTLFPMWDYKLPSEGIYGNRTGIRFSAPTSLSPNPSDIDYVEEAKVFQYRIQFVEKPSMRSNPLVIETKNGAQSIDFCLKPGSKNERVNQLTYAGDIIPESYQELDGMVPDMGPIGDIHWYQNNIDALLENLRGMEAGFTSHLDDPDAAYLVNIFTGVDYNNIPYESIIVDGPANGGAAMTSMTTHYAKGGADGDLSLAEFDAQVKTQLENFGDLTVKYGDRLFYPLSAFWDSGFSLETKKVAFNILGLREDSVVTVGTHTVGEPLLSPSEESSVGAVLRSAARLHPESDYYGTPSCRAAIFMQAGQLVGGSDKEYYPMTLEVASWISSYMSPGNGIWNTDKKPDVYPSNEVRTMRNVTHPFRPVKTRSRDWMNGLNWFESSGHRTLFCPAMQTVYQDQTSVLNSYLNVWILADLQKVARRVWRNLCGRTDLTARQFAERSDEMIIEEVRGKYDRRVVIQPNTQITSIDEILGYSWTTEIKMFASNMKTSNDVTITSNRREVLEGQ